MTDGAITLPPASVTCEVLTRREGVLSAVGHDLRIAATRSSWTVDLARGALTGVIEAAGLQVASAMRGDRDDPGALSESDRQMIDRAMRDDVLEVRRFPEIRVNATFERRDEKALVKGTVTLRGVERPFQAEATRDGAWWTASCAFDQTAFGIRPYTAMLGALKVRREVVVRVRLRLAE
jgi:polyisoprenoid-binding protein YceI